MPSPAFEKLKQAVTGTLSTVAVMGDKAFRTAVPVVRRAAADVAARVGRQDIDASEEPRAGAGAGSDAPAGAGSRPDTETPEHPAPNPATIAKNVAHQRPTVAPAPSPRPDPDSSPGGKLPPPR